MVRYFLPWWPSDYIWKEWSVADDMTRQSHWTKAYLWEYLPTLLDGILVSRMALSPRKVKTLRTDIRYSGQILGDSGAHSYRAEDQPPFSCQDLLEFYAQGQFNYGMTLDMVASPWVKAGGLPSEELERRLQLSIDNAQICLDLCDRHQYPFQLIGVVQGWNKDSYQRCAKALVDMGFDYVAIAGQRKLPLLKEAIFATQAEIRKANRPIHIHVLGSGDPRILSFYVEQKIASFDSSTWFRKAWLDNRRNYFEVRGDRYSAYRATRVGLGPLDTEALTWETPVTCSCPFCQTLNQQILLFRGHERNTRRGFHNIYQYMKLVAAHNSSI